MAKQNSGSSGVGLDSNEGLMVTLNQVLGMLESQSFADWYGDGGRFDDFIRGEEEAPTRQEILNDLEEMCASRSSRSKSG